MEVSQDDLDDIQNEYNNLEIQINDYSAEVSSFSFPNPADEKIINSDAKAITSKFTYINKCVNNLGAPTDIQVKNWEKKISDLKKRFEIKKAQFKQKKEQGKQEGDNYAPESSEQPMVPVEQMSEEQKLNHGKKINKKAEQSLQRTVQMSSDAVATAGDTALTLQAQTEQMLRIQSQLDSMDSDLDRAKKTLQKIVRRLMTDKLLVVLLLIIVIAIVGVLIYSAVKPKKK
ncbi:MAG: hypothetical protein EZS28_025486 [Streblomastix strix]|uniref:t-SNARE coiled-coil homology domain-containing protein n=1 Tax=Streblomastix strix TaxID=222440 RepID=A0A5J4V8Y2_9EUKA|nr:MAG: hypothetical protein EZS28_025486 [Streblomastix strix]